MTPLVALSCFVLAQAAWAVPLQALTHCGLDARQRAHTESHDAHLMHPLAVHHSATTASHDCCPPVQAAAACVHPAALDMAKCTAGQSCCRIEQERRVPKPTSMAGADRTATATQGQQPLVSRAARDRQTVAITAEHPRAVLDQKSDLRI